MTTTAKPEIGSTVVANGIETNYLRTVPVTTPSS